MVALPARLISYVQYNTGDNKSIARGVSIQTDGKSVVFTTAEASTSASINVGFIVMRLELNGMFDFGFKMVILWLVA